ncbi:F0F1 ATP synthase subunit gamma [Sphingomonas oryzagri]
MSDRLAGIARRIETVRQLGAVVNAIRGIAAQRAQQARALLPAIRSYAETAGRAIGQAQLLARDPSGATLRPGWPDKGGLILFGAEQGFAGAFPEQLIDAIEPDMASHHVLLIGSRVASIATERGLRADWTASLPSKADGLPGLAAAIVDALYDYLGDAGPVPIAMAYPVWTPGHGTGIVRVSLLPLDLPAFPPARSGIPPLTNLPPAQLIGDLTAEYVFARICEAAAEAFAAENEARMRTMAAARTHIASQREALALEERLTRQDEITAEVVELAAGARIRAIS